MSDDLSSGFLQMVPVPSKAYDEVLRLCRRHTAVLGVGTLDVLHVGVALTLEMRDFYTFDKRQRQLARAVGLAIPVPLP